MQIPKCWRQMIYTDAIEVNPRVHLARGKSYSFLDMASVDPSARCALASESRLFNGGGSRFVPGDTLLARITPCLENGKIARYCGPGEEAHGSTEFIVIRGHDNVTDSGYAYYLTKWEGVRGYAISQMTGTSGRQRVPTESLSNLIVPVPPLPEQRRIAHILGTLDDKIENNRKTAKTLEAMAQAIFKSWFVDFDPVRAKMAGESRESICKRLKLTPEILDLFPDRLVDSELGEIPDGWEVGMLDNLAALVTDSTSPGRSPHTVFEHYSIPAFDAGRTPAMELGESIKSNKYVIKHSAVLVSKLNPHTPRIWLPANGDGAAICSTEFMQFVPHEREDRPYLYCLMISQSMQEEVLKHVTGSTGSRQRAQPSQIAKVKILSPQSCVKKVFTHQASPLLHAVAENLTASRTLAALRDALLPRLISGEIRAADTHGCSKEILV